mgnify:CR=1 FL=1
MALLDGGANPNLTDTEGNTSLHVCESPELMAALLTRGGDPNVTNQVDQLPNCPSRNRPIVFA